MSDWLELELAQELAPVEAPDELWDRVRGGRLAIVPKPRRSPVLWLAAAAMLAATVGAVWLFGGSTAGAPSSARATMQVSCYTCHTSL
jgi:hypothetical protein